MKKIRKLPLVIAMISLGLLASGATFAQGSASRPMDEANPGQTNRGQTSPMGQMSPGQMNQKPDTSNAAMDKTFAKKAAAGGLAEVKLGELAQEKGSSAAVKDFGKRMENDHSKANDELMGIASRDNITLPSTLDKKDQDIYDALSKLSGKEFDRAYANDMVRDHEKDISDFKKEASSGGNPDVKSFASQTLPTLQDHLMLAKQMSKEVGAGKTARDKDGNPAE